MNILNKRLCMGYKGVNTDKVPVQIAQYIVYVVYVEVQLADRAP